MRKFKHVALLLLAAVVVFGCSKYDDTDLRNDVSDLQSRVEKLEKWCDTANGQITSLQGLVTALQGNDYVTGVTPVMDGATEVGYTITFTKSSPVTIMHGKNGANGNDGATPIVGVKKHTDGLYYWTIQTGSAEAVWMKDADGNMIPTTGKDGGAGQKPVISIAKDGDRYYWQVDGKWLEDVDGNKVPATGDKGENGAAGADGDSFFKSVTPDATTGTVVIKLADDTELTLPMLSTTVSFDAYTPLQISATATETEVKVILPASLKKADFAAIKADITNVAGTNSAITRAAAEKWTVALTAPTFKADGTLDAQPTVKVTVPASAALDETALLEVTLVDSKGNKSTSTRVLYYKEITIEWAVGNLVADGDHGAKIGTATDGGLFFQFGSLVGWSATDPLVVAVKPAVFNGDANYMATGKIWQGTTGTVPFTIKDSGSDNEKAGIGDPCRYYLGDTWRLPTKDEYVALFKDGGYPSGTWKWENSSVTNTTSGLTFPASGVRGSDDSSLIDVGTYGYYWSASPGDASDGYFLLFNSSNMTPYHSNNWTGGLPVRCVK